MKAMIIRVVVCLALGLGLRHSAVALDFTLHRALTAADGAPVDSTYITDGDSRIFLRIPRPWAVMDSPGALELVPNESNCRVKIENVAGVQALPFDPPGKAALRAQVDHAVPAGATNPVALPDADNPLPIFGWKDVEMTRSYDFYGQSVCYSVLFINMHPGRVVRVTITASKAAYEAIHDAVRVLMFSWFEPSKDLPPETARRLRDGTLGGS